jgi:hypothetical protein
MLTRRDFFRVTGTTVAAGAVLSQLPGELESIAHAQAGFFNQPGRIVQVTDASALKGRWKVDKEVVQKMVDKALMALTGESTPVGAMKRFVKADDVIGVHPNCLGSPNMSVSVSVTNRIIDLVKEAGIAPEKIFVYDQYGSRMRRGGYQIGKRKDGVTIGFHGSLGLAGAPTKIEGIGETKLAKILDQVTGIIDIVLPKDHDLAGVTGALKNMAFGHIEYVPKFHRIIHKAIPSIYALPQIKDKARLHVVDALKVLYHRGPQDNEQYKEPYNSIMATTDPVTCDMAILKIVDEYRKKKRLPVVAEIISGQRKSSAHITNAAAMGLGVADYDKIKWEKLGLS